MVYLVLVVNVFLGHVVLLTLDNCVDVDDDDDDGGVDVLVVGLQLDLDFVIVALDLSFRNDDDHAPFGVQDLVILLDLLMHSRDLRVINIDFRRAIFGRIELSVRKKLAGFL